MFSATFELHLASLQLALLLWIHGHRWRWRSNSLADQHLNFTPTILCTTFAGRVVRHRIRFAETIRRHDATQRNLMILYQVANDCISATLAEPAIHFRTARRIGKAGNLEHIAFRVQ